MYTNRTFLLKNTQLFSYNKTHPFPILRCIAFRQSCFHGLVQPIYCCGMILSPEEFLMPEKHQLFFVKVWVFSFIVPRNICHLSQGIPSFLPDQKESQPPWLLRCETT